jgi:hypothetical protein
MTVIVRASGTMANTDQLRTVVHSGEIQQPRADPPQGVQRQKQQVVHHRQRKQAREHANAQNPRPNRWSTRLGPATGASAYHCGVNSLAL